VYTIDIQCKIPTNEEKNLMVTLDYTKFRDDYVRESPKNEDEEALAEQHATAIAKAFIQRLPTKNFRQRVLKKLAPQFLEEFQKPDDEIDTSPRPSDKPDLAAIAKNRESLV
jgi:hypothetical protein